MITPATRVVWKKTYSNVIFCLFICLIHFNDQTMFIWTNAIFCVKYTACLIKEMNSVYFFCFFFFLFFIPKWIFFDWQYFYMPSFTFFIVILFLAHSNLTWDLKNIKSKKKRNFLFIHFLCIIFFEWIHSFGFQYFFPWIFEILITTQFFSLAEYWNPHFFMKLSETCLSSWLGQAEFIYIRQNNIEFAMILGQLIYCLFRVKNSLFSMYWNVLVENYKKVYKF